MSEKLTNLDAAESAFFLRELEAVKAKTYDRKYEKYKARELIPVDRSAGPGAETITYQSFSKVGVAKIIANYADDLPRADVFGQEFSSPVKSLGSSYGYNLQEVRTAAMAGRPLNERKATSARRAIAVQEEAIAAMGNAQTGLPGLLTNPNITAIAAAVKGAGGTTWAAPATAAEMLADLHTLWNIPYAATNGHEMINTILLPPAQYALIATTQNSAASDKTVLQFFLEHYKALGVNDVIPWAACINGGGAGVDVALGYVRSPDYLTLEIPQDFEQLPVQEDNLEFKVPCHQRIGGTIVYYPIAFGLLTGI
jgi:hypothetical protein